MQRKVRPVPRHANDVSYGVMPAVLLPDNVNRTDGPIEAARNAA